MVARGVHYTHRVAGALLLGPHMLFVGRWLDRRALAAAAKEEVLPRVRVRVRVRVGVRVRVRVGFGFGFGFGFGLGLGLRLGLGLG